MESKGQPIIYKEKKLVLADKFPISNGDTLVALIEKTNSEWRQGFSIDITGHCEMDGKIFKQGKGIILLFWEDTSPKQISLKIFSKKGFVWIQNIWEKKNHYLLGNASGETVNKESKSVDYGHNGAAMIVDEIEDGRRYRCNDGHPDDNFDDIVFTVQKIK